MTKIEINGEHYNAKTNDHDVLLKDAIAISKVKLPKNLRKFYEYLTDPEKGQPKFNNTDIQTRLPKYAKKIIKILTDIPDDILDKISPEDRLTIYKECLEDEVFSILYEGCKHTVVGLEKFTHNGIEYVLPESTEIMGVERPMYKEPFITWSEADDLLKSCNQIISGKLEAAKHIVSIIARPEGEKYDEATSLKRADSFLDLPMFVVWEVFFCTLKLQNMFSITTAYNQATNPQSKLRLHKSPT